MRKGLIRSPYVPTRKASPVVPQNFTGYVLSSDEVTDLVRKLSAIHDEFTGKIGKADSLLDHVDKHLEQSHQTIGRLTEVHDGLRIARGKDGVDGNDADEEKILSRLVELIPKPKNGDTPTIDYDKVAKMVRSQVKDGEDAKVDYDKLFEMMKEKLTIDHVPGLRGEIDSYRNQLAGKVYGEDTWARGGGDTVKAGTGVIITINADGQKVINVPGGVTPLTPTGTVNGVNKVFGVVSRPSSVIADGITYYEGFGYSYATLQITMDSPPAQYIRYYA